MARQRLSLIGCLALQKLAEMHAIDPRLPEWARQRWRYVAWRYGSRASRAHWESFLREDDVR